MDAYPVTVRTVGRSYWIEGDRLGRSYKEHLSDFNDRDQKEHADERKLLEDNVLKHMSLDEMQLHDTCSPYSRTRMATEAPGRWPGTSVKDVLPVFMRIPQEKRMAVKETTMDFSESMRAKAKAAFPLATITIDCFHVMKLLTDSIEAQRLKEKRLAVKEIKRLEAEHKERIRRNVRQ